MSTPATAPMRKSTSRRRTRVVIACALGLVLFTGEALFSWWTVGPLLGLVLALFDGSLLSRPWDWTTLTIPAVCTTTWFTGATLRTLAMLFFLQDFPLKRVLLASYGIDFALLTALLIAARSWGPF
jgi:uncharacterized membrane protein